MRAKTRTIAVALAAFLLAGTAAPAVASAALRADQPSAEQTGGGTGEGTTAQQTGGQTGDGTAAGQTGGQMTMEQLRTRLRERIREMLRVRQWVFDRARERIEARIGRIGTLAAKVDEAGGDTAGVEALLEQARSSLREAERLHAQAVERFKGVPDAPNRRQAFYQACETARNAVRALNRARVQVRDAAELLRSIAGGLGDDTR